MSDNDSSSIGWFLAGVGAGALGAILYAPKSGADTRKEIIHELKHRRDDLMERGAEVRDQVGKMVDRGKEIVDRKAEHMTSQVASAIDAGREAVHEATRKG